MGYELFFPPSFPAEWCHFQVRRGHYLRLALLGPRDKTIRHLVGSSVAVVWCKVGENWPRTARIVLHGGKTKFWKVTPARLVVINTHKEVDLLLLCLCCAIYGSACDLDLLNKVKHFCVCFSEYFVFRLHYLLRSKRQPKVLDEGFWDCSVCTYKNSPEAYKCEMCDVRKGTSTRWAS